MIDYYLKRIDRLFSEAALEFPPETAWVPERLKKDPAFTRYPYREAKKVFQNFNLHDFRIPIRLDSDDYKVNFQESILEQLRRAHFYFDDDVSEEASLAEIARELEIIVESVKFWNQPKLRLPYQVTSVGKSIRYDYGASFFKVYTNFADRCARFGMTLTPIEQLPGFKEYSKRGSYYLVFSTKINDIVGMSSRGITSCQSLDNCEKLDEDAWSLRSGLVGSVLSKFVGIIYITSGTDVEGRGERMLYRCLVRLVVNVNTREPAILIDKMYPAKKDDIYELMKTEISKRTTIPVMTQPEDNFLPGFWRQPEDKGIFENSEEAKEKSSYHDSLYKQSPKPLFNDDDLHDLRDEVELYYWTAPVPAEMKDELQTIYSSFPSFNYDEFISKWLKESSVIYSRILRELLFKIADLYKKKNIQLPTKKVIKKLLLKRILDPKYKSHIINYYSFLLSREVSLPNQLNSDDYLKLESILYENTLRRAISALG